MSRGLAESSEINPTPLMQLATGFWAFKTLSAAIDLDLFTKISAAPVSSKDLARVLGIEERPAEIMLSGCAGLGLLERSGDKFRNSPLAEQYLVKGKPYFFGGFVSMLDRLLYRQWDGVLDAIQSNKRVAAFRKEAAGAELDWAQSVAVDPAEQRIFTEAMHGISILSGRALAAAFDLSKFKQLMDVGGGSGAYCIEAVRRYPNLKAVVLDTAPVLEIAAEKLAEASVADRVRTIVGDFMNEELPRGSDVILLSMIMHDWGLDKNLMILRKCFDALPSGGALIISELMMDDDKTGPAPAALMSVNMLVATEGRNYTWAEYEEWLGDTGFMDIKRVPLDSPGANGIVVGFKP